MRPAGIYSAKANIISGPRNILLAVHIELEADACKEEEKDNAVLEAKHDQRRNKQRKQKQSEDSLDREHKSEHEYQDNANTKTTIHDFSLPCF
jgi:hypothetical protein